MFIFFVVFRFFKSIWILVDNFLVLFTEFIDIFVVDVSNFVDTKMKAIKAFKSQFYDPKSKAPKTPISDKKFLELIKSKMAVNGRDAGFDYAEAYTVERTIGVDSLFDLSQRCFVPNPPPCVVGEIRSFGSFGLSRKCLLGCFNEQLVDVALVLIDSDFPTRQGGTL